MTAETQERTDKGGKARLVYPGMGVLFIVLVCCFLSWGIAADLIAERVVEEHGGRQHLGDRGCPCDARSAPGLARPGRIWDRPFCQSLFTFNSAELGNLDCV
jgi:hypothetical protein